MIPNSILNWALSHSDPSILSSQAAGELPIVPIEQKWIDTVLGDTDSIKMKKCLKRIEQDSILEEDEKEEDVNDRMHNLELLYDLIENIDNANDMIKMNGITILYSNINHENDDIKILIWSIYAACLNNNPIFQQKICNNEDFNFLDLLLNNFNNNNKEIRNKVLLTLSSYVRNYEPSLIHIVIKRIMNTLFTNLLNDQDIKAYRRMFFIIKYILQNIPLSKELPVSSLYNNNFAFFQDCVLPITKRNLIASGDIDIIENWLDILFIIFSFESCNDTIKSNLASIITDLKNSLDSEYENLKTLSKDLILKIQTSTIVNNSIVYTGLTDFTQLTTDRKDFFSFRRSFDSDALCRKYPPIFKSVSKAAIYQFGLNYHSPTSNLILSVYDKQSYHYPSINSVNGINFPPKAPQVTFSCVDGNYRYESQEAGSFKYYFNYSSNKFIEDASNIRYSSADIQLLEHPALLSLNRAIELLNDDQDIKNMKNDYDAKIFVLINAQRILNLDLKFVERIDGEFVNDLNTVDFTVSPFEDKIKKSAPVTISHLLIVPTAPLPRKEDIIKNENCINFSARWWNEVLDIMNSAMNAARFETDYIGSVQSSQGSTNSISKGKQNLFINASEWTLSTGLHLIGGIDISSLELAVCFVQLLSALLLQVDQFIYHAATADSKETYKRAYSLLYYLLNLYPSQEEFINNKSSWLSILQGLNFKY